MNCGVNRVGVLFWKAVLNFLMIFYMPSLVLMAYRVGMLYSEVDGW